MRKPKGTASASPRLAFRLPRLFLPPFNTFPPWRERPFFMTSGKWPFPDARPRRWVLISMLVLFLIFLVWFPLWMTWPHAANLSFLDDALRRLVCCCRRNIQVVRVGGVRG